MLEVDATDHRRIGTGIEAIQGADTVVGAEAIVEMGTDFASSMKNLANRLEDVGSLVRSAKDQHPHLNNI